MRSFFALVLVAACAAPLSARADVQKGASEVWPGKVMIGLCPLGAEVLFTDTGLTPVVGVRPTALDQVSYKLGLDVAGIIVSASKVTVWLGGELNAGGRGNLAILEPGLFVQLTLEKLLKIPLVPLIRAGVAGQLYVPYGYNGTYLYGAFDLKIGVGLYYFVTKNVGVGAETHFAFGPGFYRDTVNRSFVGFNGYWDFMAGLRFAF